MPCPYRARNLWAIFLPSALRWAVTLCRFAAAVGKITTPSGAKTHRACHPSVEGN
ncbi:MAG: hypothetical protein LBP75_11850 [Planctomycetota bacterium]|nr:hypothetical protein [Planctomycetota bacterium]